MNRVLLTGRLTRDPEMRGLASGKNVTTFTVASNEFLGGGKEKAEYHAVVAWDRLAEIAGRYLGKGQQVAIEGRLQTRSWDDERGARHWKTEIVASHVEMLSGRRKKDYEAQQAADSLASQAAVLGEASAADPHRRRRVRSRRHRPGRRRISRGGGRRLITRLSLAATARPPSRAAAADSLVAECHATDQRERDSQDRDPGGARRRNQHRLCPEDPRGRRRQRRDEAVGDSGRPRRALVELAARQTGLRGNAARRIAAGMAGLHEMLDLRTGVTQPVGHRARRSRQVGTRPRSRPPG